MDWRNEQRQDALRRVFYMLIAMTLLIVRAGLVSRGQLGFFPQTALPQDEAPAGKLPLAPSPPPPAHFYPAALRLLCAAEAALRLLTAMTREVYEFMKQAAAQPARTLAGTAADQCGQPRKRLDSS